MHTIGVNTQTHPDKINPRRILIVDDHSQTASMLARSLGPFDMPVDVLTAKSGEQALETIGDDAIDILITDFMMQPGMNGLDLIRQLKVKNRTPAYTILITAYNTLGLSITARQYKINRFLTKPIQPEEINTIVTDILNNLTQALPLGAAGSSFKILIADDNPDNVRLLAVRLQHEGYSFITAYDGEETLEKIRSEKPDLVLLDINMPKKDGFEVLSDMREDPDISSIPVIVITAARVQESDMVYGLNLGADDYLTKPLNWSELSARVKSKLRVRSYENSLQRRNEELNTFSALNQDLKKDADVEEICSVFLKHTVSPFGATHGDLVVFHRDGTIMLKQEQQQERTLEETEAIKQKILSNRWVNRILDSGKEVRIEDTDTHGDWDNFTEEPVRSVVGVPLEGRFGIIGVLLLYHYEPGHFSSEQMHLLGAISRQAAISVENAQIYLHEHHRTQELAGLNKIIRDINRFTHTSDLFGNLPHMVQSAFNYPSVSLWLSKGTGPASGLLKLEGFATDGKGVPSDEWLEAALHAKETGKTALLSENTKTISVAAVPFRQGTKLNGVIAIHSLDKRPIHENDPVILETIASQVESVLERIGLYEASEQQRRNLTAILNAVPDPLFVIDQDDQLSMLNPAGKNLYPVEVAEEPERIPSQEEYLALTDLINQDEENDKSFKGEMTWSDSRTFSVMATPIEEGGRVAILHDVTSFKELEYMKDEFFANTTHDLKNPLSSILGFSQLVEQAGPLNEQQKSFLNYVQNAAGTMSELVSNLLEFARLEMAISDAHVPVIVNDLLGYADTEFKKQAERKTLTFTIERISDDVLVEGNPVQLRQMLRNLINNAIKYTPEGNSVSVTAQLMGDQIAIDVADTGLGIPEDDQAQIFDRYYRVHTDDRIDISGNGLGLAIVKAVVEKHKGQIELTSKVGEGSCFRCMFPAYQAQNDDPQFEGQENPELEKAIV